MNDATPHDAGARSPAARRWLISVALLGSGLVAGGVLAGSQLAQAAGSNTTTFATGNANTGGSLPPMTAPADMKHGPGEQLLTGSAADKVSAAALKAVPNGTIVRVETDAAGGSLDAFRVRVP